MIDFHSHILPGIDDGSKSVEMSLQMLRLLKAQGIDTVAATSHFYATQRSPQRFLFRRQEAWDKLRTALDADAPRILLGAEVLYFPGISHMEELPELCRSQPCHHLGNYVQTHFLSLIISKKEEFSKTQT